MIYTVSTVTFGSSNLFDVLISLINRHGKVLREGFVMKERDG